MKPNNALQKWMRILSGITAVMVLNLSFAQSASARILFEDDAFFKVRSEGIIIDENNDITDSDTTLQFGNDGTDGSIIHDDGTGHLGFETDGNSFILNNTDGGDEDVTLQLGNDGTNATITFDDGTGDLILTTVDGDEVRIDNANLTAASDAGLDFRSADTFAIRTTASSGADCTFVGEIIYDTEDTRLEYCTATGTPGTWSSVGGGGTDLQAAYDADASGAHEITLEAGGTNAFEVIAQANGDQLLQLKSASAAATLGSFNDIGGTTLDIDTLITDWDTTGAFTLDSTTSVHIGAADASNFTLASDGAADDLTIEVTGATDSSLVLQSTGTGADALDLNASAGGITVDSAAAISIDAVGTASNFSLASDGANDDLTIEVTGANDSSLVLQSAGTGADAVDINATGTGGGVTVNTTDGAFVLTTAGAANGDIALTAADVFDIDATDALSLNSSGGVINIGDDAVAQNINIGTGAAARTLAIGNATGATALDLDAGTGGVAVDTADSGITLTAAGAANGDITASAGDDFLIDAVGLLELNSSAGVISIGNDAVAQNINIGTGAAARTLAIGNATGATALDLDAGTGGVAVDTADSAITLTAAGATNGDITFTAGDVFDLDAVDALSINSSAGAINIGDDAVAQAINIGTGAAARAMTIGNNTGATALNLDAGTGGFVLDTTGTTSNAFDLNITGTGGGASVNTTDGSINLTAAGATNGDINITAADVLTFDDGVTSAITLSEVGETGIDAQYGNASIVGAFNLLADFTAGDGADIIGVEDSSLANLGIGTSASVQDALVALNTIAGYNMDTLYFQPEFPDAVVFADGANNKGTLESLYDNATTGNRAYYNWTTTQAGAANDINIQFHFKLPDDFVGTPAFYYEYRTNDTTEANNDIEIEVFNATNETTSAPTSCAADTTNVSGVADAWTNNTIGTAAIETGCTGGTALDPGDVVLVQIKLIADGDIAGAYADVGAIEFTYASN